MGDGSASAVLDGDAGHRLLTEHLPGLGVVGFDHDLVIRIATGTAVWAEGFAPAELVGRRLPELARHGDAETLAERCRAALAGEGGRIELPGARNPGAVWLLDFVPLRGRDGTVVAGMMLARDVTEERRAERIVRASQRQLAEAQRVAQLGSWESEVVVVDLRMPVLNGLDATRLIKEALPAVQVVLLSAFDSPALRRQAAAAGCFAYLVKGVPAERLQSVLRDAVACCRASR